MAASVTDKFRKGAAAFSTTLASQKALGASTATLSDTTGVPTDTAVDLTIGRVDSSGNRTPSAKAVYKATISGTTASNLTLVEGTDQLHAAGTPVEITFTKSTWNDAVDGILAEHNQSGGHTNITVSGTSSHTGVATFTSHIDVNDSSTAIRDSSDNELLKFSKTSSAVNELTITNAATGNAPDISATGGDTNISMTVTPKGTGVFKLPEGKTAGIIRKRQGGSSTNWGTAGTTTYDYSGSATFIQTGAITGNTDGADKAVTFPTAFNQVPLVFVLSQTAGSANVMDLAVNTVTTTGFNVRNVGANASTETIGWLAIGQ